jgi:CheY-like chemotaxis protein
MIQRRRVILLVEDNPDDVALTRRAFARSSIATELAVARDGEEALHYLLATGPYQDRDPSQLPAVMLLDLKLPGIGGLDVLRRVRANPATKHLPVVILTTSAEHDDLLGSYGLGANSYVRKPVDFAQFMEAARQLGLYWLELNEPPPS